MVSTPANNKPVQRLALVGAGRWGRNYIRTMAELPQVRLTRVASRNADNAALLPPGCVLDADWRVTVAAADVDAVIVATPPQTHAVIAAAALAAGKAVLVEKPLTLDPAEARALAEQAHEAGLLAWVEHTPLFNPAFRALRQALPRVGRVGAIRSQAGNHGPFRADVPVLWDWGAHDLAMILALTGGNMPMAIAARHTRREWVEGGQGAVVEVELTFADGLHASAVFGNLCERSRKLAVYGDAGTLLFDDLAADKVTFHPPQSPADWPTFPVEVLDWDPTPPLTRAICDFVAALDGSGDDGNLDFGVVVVTLLDLCAKAADPS